MAKAASSKKASSGSGGGLDSNEAIILKYLQSQNRPYNANDIFANLHSQVGKTLVTKALASLAEKGEILGKAYGKQSLYVARQDNLPMPSPEDLDRLDGELESCKVKLQEQKETTRQLQARLNVLQSSLTNEQLELNIKKIEAEIKSSNSRLESLRSGIRLVDPVEKAKIDKIYEVYQKEAKARKKTCMEIINAITENMPKSPAEFMEELGLELDPKN